MTVVQKSMEVDAAMNRPRLYAGMSLPQWTGEDGLRIDEGVCSGEGREVGDRRRLVVRLRQRVTKGAGSMNKALSMAWKLCDMAQARWRRLNGPHLLPLVRSGNRFVDGELAEREGGQAKDAA